MRNLIIIGGVGLGVYVLLKGRMPMTAPEAAYTGGGLKTMDTQGREIIFQTNKNGYLIDQFGGMWA